MAARVGGRGNRLWPSRGGLVLKKFGIDSEEVLNDPRILFGIDSEEVSLPRPDAMLLCSRGGCGEKVTPNRKGEISKS